MVAASRMIALGTGLPLVLVATAALGDGPEVRDFVVGEGAKRLLPLTSAPAAGTTVVLKEHKPALAAAIAFEAVTTTGQERAITIGGIDWTIPSATRLIMMSGWSGGDTGGYASGTSLWCEINQREPRKTKVKPSPELKALLKKSYAERVTLCLVDLQDDGTFDRVLVSGAKLPELRRSVEIEPLAYRALKDLRLPNSYLAVVFHHQNMFHTPRFYVQGFMFGREIIVHSLGFPVDPANLADYATVAGSIDTPPGKLPRELRFGSGRFTVLSIDSKAKQATVRIDGAWRRDPVRITQTVYTY